MTAHRCRWAIRARHTHFSSRCLLVIPLMTAGCALVKDTHGLICRSNLHLQKVSLVMIALWADCLGPVDIFPRCRSSQDIVHLLALLVIGNRLDCDTLIAHFGNGTGIGTGGAIKRVAKSSSIGIASVEWSKARLSILFNLKETTVQQSKYENSTSHQPLAKDPQELHYRVPIRVFHQWDKTTWSSSSLLVLDELFERSNLALPSL
jgi:hypothetical protein